MITILSFRRLTGPDRNRRGVITILAAVCLMVVIAFLTFSVDLGYLVVVESELQNAADSAAASGARALPHGRSAAIAAAKTWAAKNTAGGTAVVVENQDVEVGVWDDATATFTVVPAGSSTSANAVRVTCRRTAARGNPIQLFFAPLLGSNSADLSVKATAKIERDICGLFIGLESVDIQNAVVDSYRSEDGPYLDVWARNNGDVCSNGDIDFSPNGFVHGDARPGISDSVSHPAKVSGSVEPLDKVIQCDPVDTAGPAASNDNHLLPSWALTDGGKRLVAEGQTVITLLPGTYYLPKGLRVAGNGQIIITGPTKLVLGGNVSVEGGGLVNAALAPENLRIEMVSSSARIAGSASLYADIYAPSTDLTVATSQHGAFYGGIVARKIKMEGSVARLHGDESLRDHFDTYTSRASLRQ
ncbi:hypothetical protein Mal4_45020 [Maioricimonas rarisocia]|uniref:Uncharacterized protein n=1 Tax=Maioricimonas rarisocia TaxID=2528026 RepID=A0A517ZCG6_9PLAN|nr:TadG family pilus assembly protein [Maioricimonas rarisocia]QDU40147.1 hypothetical protein Mal4_45020 [Maioricimonas rarisocia]